MTTNCFGIPDIYRGWTIEQGPDDQFYGTGPDYDASYEGEEDGWVDNGHRCCSPTWDSLREEIDEWFEENPCPSIEAEIARLQEQET